MEANTWKEVGINTLDDVNPEYDSTSVKLPKHTSMESSTEHKSIIIAWCGACFDDNESVLWLPLGGHSDYAGKYEPYKEIDLSVNSPTWEMVRPPSGAIGNQMVLDDGQEATGLYSDGRLRAVHSYNKPVYVPQIGPVMSVTGMAYKSAGAGLRQPAFIKP